jgi:hypothetical protein
MLIAPYALLSSWIDLAVKTLSCSLLYAVHICHTRAAVLSHAVMIEAALISFIHYSYTEFLCLSSLRRALCMKLG